MLSVVDEVGEKVIALRELEGSPRQGGSSFDGLRDQRWRRGAARRACGRETSEAVQGGRTSHSGNEEGAGFHAYMLLGANLTTLMTAPGSLRPL